MIGPFLFACPRCHRVVSRLRDVIVQVLAEIRGPFPACDRCIDELRADAADDPRMAVTLGREVK